MHGGGEGLVGGMHSRQLHKASLVSACRYVGHPHCSRLAVLLHVVGVHIGTTSTAQRNSPPPPENGGNTEPHQYDTVRYVPNGLANGCFQKNRAEVRSIRIRE